MSYPATLDDLSAKTFENKTKQENAHPLAHAEERGAIDAIETALGTEPAGSQASVAARLGVIDKGTNWGAGEEVHIYQAAPGRNAAIKLGESASPDKTFGPPIRISRTLEILEEKFTGDGADGLAAIAATSHALSGSQAQAIGLFAGAITDGTYLGTNSHSDAIGGYFIGKSTSGSTRSGQGIFALGRREAIGGVACGNETVCDNETAEAGTYNSLGASTTRGIWLHPIGTADSGCGLQIGHTTSTAHWEVGIGVNKEAVTQASFRDDSEATRSIQIKGSHAKAAISVAAGAGPVVIGEEEAANATSLFEALGGNEAHDPIAVFRVTGSNNIRIQLSVNGSGNVSAFAAGGTNSILTGTVAGDSGFTFAAGKTLHIGAQGHGSIFRISEAAIGLYGVAPVARHAAIAEPAETLASLKEKVNQIREAIKNIGITE